MLYSISTLILILLSKPRCILFLYTRNKIPRCLHSNNYPLAQCQVLNNKIVFRVSWNNELISTSMTDLYEIKSTDISFVWFTTMGMLTQTFPCTESISAACNCFVVVLGTTLSTSLLLEGVVALRYWLVWKCLFRRIV